MPNRRAKAWLKNEKSPKYKQLQYALEQMPEDFTTSDMVKFMRYSWSFAGLKGHNGKILRVITTESRPIAAFLARNKSVRVIGLDNKQRKIYRRNKNVMD